MSFRLPHIPSKWWRRAAQLLCLFVFLWLFRKTESDGSGSIAYGANIFFRLDPLVAASAVLAGVKFIAALWPALITVALTLVLGRFFCGWVCPLGTLLDIASHAIPKNTTPPNPRWRVVKYFLLGVVLASAVLSCQIVGYLDPFSILVRGMAVAVDPWMNRAVTAPFTLIYQQTPESVSNFTEPIYAFLKAHLLPFQQNSFVFSIVSFVILAGVFALEFAERRFWCRNICPAGALIGIFARFSLLRRFPARACGRCKAETDYTTRCRMGAFDGRGLLQPESCNLCLDCLDDCPIDLPKFTFDKPKTAPAPFEPSRRLFLGSVVTGMALPLVSGAMHAARGLPPDLVRPPGALPEPDFLDLCVRCAECMKVCTTNALQPVLFEDGLDGAFSPRFMGRIGYCEYNCTLCAQVCPTGAIALLPLPEKQKFIMAKAVFDKELCLPFKKAESCITCEEHCPLPEKAILFKDVEVTHPVTKQRVIVKRPYIVWSLCIGCGICETKCPIEGKSAVRMIREEAVPPAVRSDPEIMDMVNLPAPPSRDPKPRPASDGY
ncbi:MAG: 4Fe-4S binding protein [Verrucomicrobia bacterium]|nr:4Fe-4S binding protein [Verrucomicrobiota bacterium]